MSTYTNHHNSNAVNGNSLVKMSDGSGTVNPAALNTADSGPRGIKRSRSPELVNDEDDDESKPRKRGRPPKTPQLSADFTSQSNLLPRTDLTPLKSNASDKNQSSPPRTTPKSSTVKALPTVRDHTSDQLNPESDEFIPREFDEAGEQKVDNLGYLQGGREYKIRTFTLPGRGDKLFMLATECARQLQYRDSYLLFNKNRSLYKIIASAKEKEELVNHEILPYSYRSRQIAIVTARSMFRQFGSRVVKDGRRVRDDYWEAKAIKQGFTEQDAAGEKRPGGGKAREAATSAAQDQIATRQLTAYGDVVYSNGPGFGAVQPPAMPSGVASTMANLPGYDSLYDGKYRDIIRPRQEMTGAPYVDTTRTSTEAEMAGQAGHAAEYSKQINQQAQYRRKMIEDYWHRPHEQPATTPPAETEIATTNNFTSPRFPNPTDTSTLLTNQQILPQSMNPPSYPHQSHLMQSPVRQQQQFPRDTPSQFTTPQHPPFPRSSSNLSISQTVSQQQTQQLPYGAGFSPRSMTPQQQQQGWGGPPTQPHQSPALHRMSTPQFSPPRNQIPQSPHPQPQSQSNPQPQQHTPQQQHMQPPQLAMMQQQAGGMNMSMAGLPNQSSAAHLYGPGAGLQAMNAAGYGNQMNMQRMAAAGGMGQINNAAAAAAMAGMGMGGGAGMGIYNPYAVQAQQQWMNQQGQSQGGRPDGAAGGGQQWNQGF